MNDKTLGINGLGRIGKLTLWHHVARGFFDRIVINLGREVGPNLDAVCQAIETDSTYGSMHRFLFGVNAAPCVRIVDREAGELQVAKTRVTVLQRQRNPKDIPWRANGVNVVVDATGAFCDPTLPLDHAKGALRGHLGGGARVVLNSAAFKVKGERKIPDDAVTLIYGINHHAFDPSKHAVLSAASCTTTALAHMVKPVFDSLDASSVLTASMSTVHAVTNSQSVLDSVPKAGAKDLRKSRSVLNSIILTSTNAANALEQVIPEVSGIGFMADSVRIPTPTLSLIILNLTFQAPSGSNQPAVDRARLNEIYRQYAEQTQLMHYSERQNVPADVTGLRAAVSLEACETHTRTGFIAVDLAQLGDLDPSLRKQLPATLHVPVTHAKIFGWYDNEYGSYTNMLGDLTEHVHKSID